MKNLQEATERICELKGSLVALDALVPSVIEALSRSSRASLMASFEANAEVARTALLHTDISDVVLAAFERDVARNLALLQWRIQPGHSEPTAGVDALLLTTTRIATFSANDAVASASGFFFRRGEQLFLVGNRHVFADGDDAHLPDRMEFGVHTDAADLTRHVAVSLPLHQDGLRLWREATHSGGTVDIAAMPIPAGSLPPAAVLQAFDDSHLEGRGEAVAIGDTVTIVGFPHGLHDAVHHLPVARTAAISSAFGVRFQGHGCFLTDARTHCGSSGSPVVRRRANEGAAAPSWQLLGVHSTRMDLRGHGQPQDEAPGLARAWYADVLTTLTGDP